ncbi:serine protease, partial [Microbacterium sp. ISL-103]|nr:serine protease [Microbacterium sp. ISL-103]
MNEDSTQDHSASASNDAVPSTEAAEGVDRSTTAAAAENPRQGHEVPSTFASEPTVAPAPQVPSAAAPAAPTFEAPAAYVSPTAQTAPQHPYAAPGSPSGHVGAPTATAPGAAFGIHTAAQPAPLDPSTKTKEHKPRTGVKFAAIVVAAALVGGVAGFGGGAILNGITNQTSTGVAQGPDTVTVNNPGSVNETTAVATEALPSVVTIEVAGSDEAGSGSGVL